MTPDHTDIERYLRDRYRDYAWRPVNTASTSGARTFRLTGPADLHLKYTPKSAHPDPGFDVLAEYDRLRWLADQNVPAPEVVDFDGHGDHTYLVTTSLPGTDGTDDWPAHQRIRVIDAIADFLADLHSLPVEECPFDRTLRVTVPRARSAAALDLVDLDDLDPARRGWDTVRLLTELETRLRTRTPEEPVVAHGDFCLPNILIDPATLTATGIVDVGRLGLADRYADLALMLRSVTGGRNPQYGPEHGDRFLYRYGEIPADRDRVGLYTLLDEFF